MMPRAPSENYDPIREYRPKAEETMSQITRKTRFLTFFLTFFFQNQPNPFSEKTSIRYELNTNFSSAKIVVRNLDGVLMMEQIISAKGKNQIEINAHALSSGTYTYTLEIDNRSVDTKLMVLTR